MRNTITLKHTIEVGNELGEGIIWDAQRQCLWWTDIQQSRLYRYELATNTLNTFTTPERLACLTPVQNDPRLLCAFASGLALFTPESGKVDWIAKLEGDNPGTRCNDGKTDRWGRFWVGTMVEDSQSATNRGKLYCLNHDLSITEHLTDLRISNSLCWSPDGGIAYHTDTPTRLINQYLSASSTQPPSLKQADLFVATERHAYPDGSCVDAQGFLWNAQWGASQVVRYAADGTQDLTLPIAASQPTCPTFAGPQLNLLAVTSARADLSPEQRQLEPHAGHVFIFTTPFKGIADQPFILRLA